ncbi:hypothetical protein KpIITR008_39 [Klebsiella phage KpIITR008]
MRIFSWLKEQYAVHLLLRAERLWTRADYWRVTANNYAHKAHHVGSEVSAYRYKLAHDCARARRKAYTIGALAAAAENKACTFIAKHKLKGFD